MRTKGKIKALCRRLSALEELLADTRSRVSEGIELHEMNHEALTRQDGRIGSAFQSITEITRRETLSVEVLTYYDTRLKALEKAAGLKKPAMVVKE